MAGEGLKQSIKYANAFLVKHTKIVISIFVSVIAYRVSQYYYFGGNPFFNFTYLGESTLGAISFILIYFIGFTFGDLLLKKIQGGIKSIMTASANEFWAMNSGKISSVLNKKEDIESHTRLNSFENAYLIDTSSLIDGRIVGVIKTGFIQGKMIVTQGVVDELQYMADKADSMKRTKGRLGLDNIKNIKKYVGSSNFYVANPEFTTKMPVDKTLVEFCKTNKAKLITVDYNLNKAAKISGVKVLNINKLANELKTNLLPGDKIIIRLLQKGKEKSQAVGYLEDGTMIIVQDGEDYIGSDKEITVERVLQTEAGKLIFGSITK